MIHLSQRDPRWKDITLGNSRFTIGKVGCTTTCISMLSDYFQCFQPPDALAKTYIKYTIDGLVIWNSISLSRMAIETRFKVRDDKFILSALKDPNRAVILNVAGGSHWIVAIKKDLFRNDYVCVDPWFGDVCLAVKRYGNISGGASFHLK